LDQVPFLVALALLIGKTIVPGRGRAPLDRALLVPVYSWHVMGPVAVLALAGEHAPRLGDWPVYFAALVAQFAVDFAVSGSREWIVKGVRPSSQLPFMGWVFLVDAALASVGLLAALAAVHQPAIALLLLPLIGLLSVFAHERQMRIDHALELSHAYRGTAFLLGDVVEADDPYTGTHSRDVVTLVLEVCDELGLEPSERRDAEFDALRHKSLDRIRHVREPGSAAHLAVRENVDADLPLFLECLRNGVIFFRPELFHRDLRLRVCCARLKQFRGTQQTSNLFSSISCRHRTSCLRCQYT